MTDELYYTMELEEANFREYSEYLENLEHHQRGSSEPLVKFLTCRLKRELRQNPSANPFLLERLENG